MIRARRLRRLGLAWAAGIILLCALRNPPAFAGWGAALEESLHSLMVRGSFHLLSGPGLLVWAVFVFLVFNLGMAGAGNGLLRFFGSNCLKSLAPLARIPVTLLLGWGASGSILFGFACCGLFRGALLGIGLLACAVLAVRGARRAGRRSLGMARAVLPRSQAARLCAALALAALSVTSICSLAPQTEIDSLIHNLPLAARIVSLGSIVPLPDNSAFHVSALSEMLRAFAMGQGGEAAANLFNSLGTAVTALLLVALIRPAMGEGWAWFGAALYCANSFAFLMGQTSKPDLLLAPLGLAVLMLAGRGPASCCLSAGLLLGTATAMKYSAGLLAPALLILLLVQRNPHVLGFSAGVALPVIPWLAKSWLLTGNPVFPFAYGIFGGLGLDAAGQDKLMWFAGNVLHVEAYDSWPERLTALWTLTMREGLPPAWLALLPLGLMARGARGARLSWRVAALGFLGLWMTGPIQFRYLAPVMPVLLFLGISGLAQSRSRASLLLAGALALFQAGHMAARSELPDRFFAGLGLELRGTFFARSMPLYAQVLRRIRELPGHGKIMCLGHSAAYPLADRLLAPAVNKQFTGYCILRASFESKDIWRRLRQLGVSHVLYNPPHATYMRHLKSGSWAERDVELWARFWRQNAREIFRSPWVSRRRGFFVLYSLSRGSPSPAALSYLPGLEYALAGAEELWMQREYARAEKSLEAIEERAGDFGNFQFFMGHFLRVAEPAVALGYLDSARKAGYWDLVLWEDLEETGRKLGRRDVIAEARASRRMLVREE